MKTITTIITAILLSVLASQAAIDGVIYRYTSGVTNYVVPSGKIFVLQQVAFTPGITAANANLLMNGVATVNIPSATNGLYVLPKALFLPAGTTLSASVIVTMFGVLIDTSDAPLFVGGGSSFGNVALVNNTMTGELQLPSTAGSKVLFQSSSDLANWDYDSSVMVQRSSNKTKVRFTVPVAGAGRYYRALVRRTNAG